MKFINWKMEEEKKSRRFDCRRLRFSHYEGEAYLTVSGQNSNNSVRITERILQSAEEDGDWELKARPMAG